jgi:hypothetical protein
MKVEIEVGDSVYPQHSKYVGAYVDGTPYRFGYGNTTEEALNDLISNCDKQIALYTAIREAAVEAGKGA